ncbi:MBOAT family protein [Desulfovibrio desulfuricans]|uniref:MBOAT family O-acyltransferase n=1 Tax=Desulfovibrio desulfuricans TaxID=876 RepID=UPI0035AD931F
MLFNSYSFLFAFLPLLLVCWRLTQGYGPTGLALVMLAFSVVFYGLWGLPFLILLAVILGMNYAFALALAAPEHEPVQDAASAEATDPAEPAGAKDKAEGACLCGARKQTGCRFGLSRKSLLTLALVLNLLPLLWFKYSAFLAQNLGALLHAQWHFTPPGLPLGISFYTFIQIAWLVSVYRGQVSPQGFTRHALFSACFPYVISGPIVRYEQMGPQFDALAPTTAENLAQGFTLFTIGMVKKVLLADSIAMYADSVFNAAEKAFPLSGAEAWLGSLCYTFQLYFDFSGYTDMAIGLALMLGLKLPENFDSPYKSTGIVDFWRRWHITLSSWLRDFLYIPLGGNRQGRLMQYRNLFLTMLIGGAWHGAGWTFIVWGALHGMMLSINHFFRACIKGKTLERVLALAPFRLCSILFTFFCINLCWVVFRALTIEGAGRMYKAMFTGPFTREAAGLSATTDGLAGFAALAARWLPNNYIQGWIPFALLLTSFAVVWALPNSREMLHGRRDGSHPRLSWRPTAAWATGLAVMAFLTLILVSRKATFLYFQF